MSDTLILFIQTLTQLRNLKIIQLDLEFSGSKANNNLQHDDFSEPSYNVTFLGYKLFQIINFQIFQQMRNFSINLRFNKVNIS